MCSDVLPKSESNREKRSQFMCAQLCTDANGRRKDMRTYYHTHTHAYKGALESTTSSSEDSRRGAHFIFHQSIGLQLVKLILYSKTKKKKTKRRRRKRKMGKKSEKGCWKILWLIDLRAKSVKRKRMSAFTPFPISLSINIHIHS